MKTIPLTRGQFAIVDDEDIERTSKIKWYSWWCKQTNSFYAIGYEKGKGKYTQHQGFEVKGRFWYLHRFITNAQPEQEIDHKNHNTLDCQKKNLRIVTRSQNSLNQRKGRRASSIYKGVSRHREKNGNIKWVAQFNHKYIGVYNTPEEAAKAYNEAAYKFDPVHCFLNTIKV